MEIWLDLYLNFHVTCCIAILLSAMVLFIGSGRRLEALAITTVVILVLVTVRTHDHVGLGLGNYTTREPMVRGKHHG
jgi:hypothetical protein